MTAAVVVDAAGGQTGGASRFRQELLGYLARTGRSDVQVISSRRHVSLGWLVLGGLRSRRMALNNVGFLARGGQRWTLLRNANHFLTEAEQAALRSMGVRASVFRDAVAVRLAARRSDVIVVPSTTMAERVARVTHGPRGRIVVRAHPRIELIDRLPHAELRELQARSCATYYPPELESFGYPLAEARVSGQPVIACDTEHNREIAGSALCGSAAGDHDSLRHAVELALTAHVTPDPAPFDPDRYFSRLLESPR